MFIDLNHTLFNVDPDVRFSKQFKVPEGTWRNSGRQSIWYRRKWLEYEYPEIQEYLLLKYKIEIHRNTLMRWFNRTEVYLMAERYKTRGAKAVRIDEFKDYKDFIKSELKIK